jgi:hypothetical protein
MRPGDAELDRLEQGRAVPAFGEDGQRIASDQGIVPGALDGVFERGVAHPSA